ncbi:MAG: transcriptional repressor LexA [Proteobacteria bacterium]|nr:transcriptional repressor LexA [Pseudomonadota bacterium]
MLTGLEEKILQCVTRYITQNGHAPTLVEIGKLLDINSKGTIHRYIESLIDKGHLQRNGRSWRGIRLTGEQNRRLTILPFAGRIAAGRPIEAVPEQLEINFSEMLLGADRYVLEVKGDSMIEVGILDGDLVVIRQAETADNGDIVVALIDNGEATLKKLRKHGDRVELIPANRSMAPLIYPADRVHIQGVVVGQVRSY